jgi:hypothetical protein
MVKPIGPLDTLTKRLAFFPGSMVAIRALKPSDMHLQGDRAIQDGQVTDASLPALFDPEAAPLTVRTHEVRISAFKTQL